MKALRTLAVLLAFASFTALAQKPALVKDTEAAGRIPYIHTLETPCPLNNPGSCPVLTYTFPAIPTGYRLVVTHVGAQYFSDSGADTYAVLTNGEAATDADYAALTLQSPACLANTQLASRGGYLCTSSGPVSFYVEAGLTPKVIIHTGRGTSAYVSELERVTVVGYLISI